MDRLRAARRTIRLVFTDGFRAAPSFMALTTVFTMLSAVASIGDVVLAVSLLRRAQFQVGNMSNLTGQLPTIVRTARRFQWLEDFSLGATRRYRQRRNGDSELPNRKDTTNAVAASEVPSTLRLGITFDGVAFRYPGTELDVLRRIDLELPAGTTVALVGENGAGKTTLVKLLSGMYLPDKGTVAVDGTNLRQMDMAAWRARISVAFQDFVQYQLLAGQTVGVGDLPHLDDRDAVTAALDRANALDVVSSLRDGLSTPLGRSFTDGQDLSGGQWQKLALGRGMMREQPLLIVLDEPTASLDAPTEHAIFERSMTQARRAGSEIGAVTLLVSHRFSTVRMADLIVVLDGGTILESGTHEALVRNGGRYAELFELQAKSYR
jgi:ATP-binding cassette, subfamily B, bacterial